ncbi:unnamed protein product, partial [Musa banksii]
MRALSPARSPLSNNPFSSDLLPLLYNYRRRCLHLLIRSPPPLPPSRLISEIISLRSNVKLFSPVIELKEKKFSTSSIQKNLLSL